METPALIPRPERTLTWDRRYYLHSWVAEDEYVFTGVERTDGNYLRAVLAKGVSVSK